MKILFLFFLSFLSPVLAFAGEIETVSDIFAVTVFPDRADISRIASLDIPAGKHTLVFNRMPDGLITDSLRVEGKGSSGFTIGSVETKQIFTSEFAIAEEKALQDKIAALHDQRRFIEAQINAANAGKTFLENMAKTPAATPIDAKTQSFSPAVWQEAWHTIQNGMNELGRETIEKQQKIREIDKEINTLNRQLREISTGKKGYKQIRVNVETNKLVKARMTLQYQIKGASWKPLYEARLDSANETVEIVQYGNIAQKTGEDWTNVALTLSTARPSLTMRPPVLSPIWLNIRSKEIVVRHQNKHFKSTGAIRSQALNLAATDSIALGAAASSDEDEVFSEKAENTAVSVDGREFSGEFAIKGASNVPADGAEYRFNIGSYTNKAEIRAEIFPQTDSSAYLIASVLYNGSLPLLPGNIALFRDGAFIGNSDMEMLRPNEKLNLAFGQDEKISVSYTVLGGETSEGGVISRDTKKDLLSRTEIQNLHNLPLKIAIYEQLPVSRNSDVSVKIIKDKTSAGYVTEPDGKVGLIQWESVFPAKEKKEILFGYSVSWPKDKILTGL